MMVWLLAFLSIVYAREWNDEIASALKKESIGMLSKQFSQKVTVEVDHLGLAARTTCAQLDEVDVVLRSDEDFRGPIPVKAYLKHNNQICQTLSFRARIAVFMEMLVSARAVAPKKEIEVEKAIVRYDLLQGTPIEDPQGPWISRTSLKKKEPLTYEKVKLKPLNNEGDLVEILFKTDKLEIRMSGKLLREGYRNSRVKVLSLTTSTILEGILVHKNLVEVSRPQTGAQK